MIVYRTLSAFVTDSDMLERLQSQAGDRLETLNLSSRLHTVSIYAGKLYAALERARLPECADSHGIVLHLDDHMIQKNKLKQPLRPEVSFPISISKDAACAQWYRTAVTVTRPQNCPNIPIEDICHIIQRAEHLEHSFHLLNDMLSKIKLPPNVQRDNYEEVDAVPLDHLLQAKQIITPKDITILSLIIASSIVQLGATGWLERCLTKKAIIFFPLQGKGIYLTSSPSIMKVFRNDPASVTDHRTKPIDALFELGILLLEIGNKKTFEMWLEENDLSCADETRFARLPVALQWYEESDGLLPIKYRIVVAKCLKCSFDDYKLSWDDVEFRQAICREVIEPLHQNTSIW